MTRQEQLIGTGVRVLGIVATVGLLYNLVALRVYREEFFLTRGPIGWEAYIVMGFFLIIFLFDVSSVFWITFAGRDGGETSTSNGPLVLFGVTCIILMIGVKIMLDEIGRTDPMGEAAGEWIVLFVLLSIQMVYNYVILSHDSLTR